MFCLPCGIQGANFAAVFLLLGAYGLAVPGSTYIVSFVFKKNNMAQTVIMAGYTLLNMVTFFTSFLLEYPQLGIPDVAGQICRYVFMLFPNYALSKVRAHGSVLGADTNGTMMHCSRFTALFHIATLA